MNDFYLSKEWRSVRWKCLLRDSLTCQRCEERFKWGHGLTSHHIRPRMEGGSDDLNNLIALCNPCHDEIEGMGLSRWEIEAGITYEGREPVIETEEDLFRPYNPVVNGVLYASPRGFVVYHNDGYPESLPTSELNRVDIAAGP